MAATFLRRSFILALFLFSGASTEALSAELRMDAFIDRPSLPAGEELVLTVKLEGEVAGSLPTPTTPSHEGFDMIGIPQQSSSFSWVNGKVTSSKSLRYRLRAQAEGRYMIGLSNAQFRGENYSTQPIEVTVEKPTAPVSLPSGENVPPAASADPSGRVIIAASLNKSQVYAGESVVYTFSFFRKVRIWESPEYKSPEFTGFWVEELPRESSPREVLIKGERYLREDVKKVLFPTRDGYLPIEGSALAVQLDPFSNPVQLVTEPIELEVLTLPQEPEGYNGAVGNFTISAAVDRKKVKEGEPFTVKVDISGMGNIRAIKPPIYEETDDLKGYEPKDSVDLVMMNDLISGSKYFEFLFVPSRPGNIKIPSFSLVFFDPENASFSTVNTEAIDVFVEESSEGIVISRRKAGDGGASSSAGAFKPLRMKSELDDWRPSGYLKGGTLFFIVFPPFVALLAFLRSRLLERRGRRGSDAVKTASAAISNAERLLAEGNTGAAFDEAVKAFMSLISRLAEEDIAKKTGGEACEMLEKKGFSAEELELVKSLWARAEKGRYSPTSGGAEEVKTFIGELNSMVQNILAAKGRGGAK